MLEWYVYRILGDVPRMERYRVWKSGRTWLHLECELKVRKRAILWEVIKPQDLADVSADWWFGEYDIAAQSYKLVALRQAAVMRDKIATMMARCDNIDDATEEEVLKFMRAK